MFKRSLDIILATFGLIFFSPIFILCSIIIYFGSPGPIFFRQERLGKDGKTFKIIKFRTMAKNAEKIVRNDPELYNLYKKQYKIPEEQNSLMTPWGKIMRKTSMDELPQLFNILKGNMSIVGPRPIVPEEIMEYGAHGQKFLSVKPGLTGYWQVSGRNLVGYPQRVFLDMYYIDHQSFWLDLQIILKTFPVVLKMRGTH